MRVAAIDDNHFQITANTDGQILFNILLDKDYPGRIKRMNLRKFSTFDGAQVDNFSTFTALKVRDVREDSASKLVIWNTNSYSTETNYLEIYGIVEDAILPEEGAGFRFSTSTMTTLPILAVINKGVINIYEIGELQLKITKSPPSSSSSSTRMQQGISSAYKGTETGSFDESFIFNLL